LQATRIADRQMDSMAGPAREHNALLRMLERTAQELKERREELVRLQKAADDYEELEETLRTLPARVERPMLVPYGKLAFFPGVMVHTNEIMVLLGDNYMALRSAEQAAAIAGRRAEYVRPKVAAAEAEVTTLTARIRQIRAYGEIQGGQDGTIDICEPYCSDEDDGGDEEAPALRDSDDDTDAEEEEIGRPAVGLAGAAGRRVRFSDEAIAAKLQSNETGLSAAASAAPQAAAPRATARAGISEIVTERDPLPPPSEVDITLRDLSQIAAREQQGRIAAHGDPAEDRDPLVEGAEAVEEEGKPVSRFKARMMRSQR